ncbi:hypothetical protein JAAARDRAFT_132798 [Jaapia argillacea MUCL 33604]|uniref:Ketoreductase (KR) domain-containing protein n=1 Tax=Jaapia argillacea MUCL 33604 TaxID=933084 RepID=A0A067Q178_9AGAM|nr:hypothetical protein JAAARDRAFT_132798 [Jaapia argillacea MUCL 33604]
MVLEIAASIFSTILPSKYYIHAALSVLVIVVVRAFAQGRSTNRERDLHARVILVTGGFTPLGLTLIQALAQRGAHIIALSPSPIDSLETEVLIDLIRNTTSNENIFAEQCDLTSPTSVRAFCTRLLTAEENRLDAIVFAHEYKQVGSVLSGGVGLEDFQKIRESGSMTTFLMITLLLPILLVAPPERDIRIVNVVNPFYAAAVPSFSPNEAALLPKASSTFVREGHRSLRMAVLTRHLQRVLDALPSAQVPKTDETAAHVVSDKLQRSNIVAITVSPGFSRSDTVSPLLGADRDSPNYSSWRFALYLVLQPFLRVLTKSTNSALQSVLHVLFLPTPFKTGSSQAARAEEVLKPGALYSDCSVVRLNIPPLPASDAPKEEAKTKGEGESTGLPDDGELGGEMMGRLVWERFEERLKEWERSAPPEEKKEKSVDPPSTDS